MSKQPDIVDDATYLSNMAGEVGNDLQDGERERLSAIALEVRRLRGLLEEATDALEACEKNLRVVHEAAGPEPFDDSVLSSFECWKISRDTLARIRGETKP